MSERMRSRSGCSRGSHWFLVEERWNITLFSFSLFRRLTGRLLLKCIDRVGGAPRSFQKATGSIPPRKYNNCGRQLKNQRMNRRRDPFTKEKEIRHWKSIEKKSGNGACIAPSLTIPLHNLFPNASSSCCCFSGMTRTFRKTFKAIS